MSPRLSDRFLNAQSDERLVNLAREGHERAFVAIVERYRPELQAHARRLCSDGRSEDVVQQAFLSAFAALRAGAKVRHLRGWLYQIVRNAANRPQAPVCVSLDRVTATVDAVEDVVQQRALAMSALTELARLPARQRQAMIGTALDGRARADVASSMGLSEGAVRQLVHRARTTLRGVVTAVTPWPLARWLVAMRPDAPGTAEVATGAGIATSGGLTFKLGALLASGTFLTGAAVVDLHRAPSHPAGARVAVPGHIRAGTHGASLLAHAPAASSTAAGTTPAVARTALSRPARPGSNAEPRAARVNPRVAPAGSAGRSGGERLGGRHGGVPPAARGGYGGGPGAGSSHNGGPSLQGSGSDGHGQDGRGAGSGARIDGGDGRGTSSRTGSDGGGDAQMASASGPFGSAGGDSSSRQGSRFGATSASRDGSGSGGDGSSSAGGGSGTGGDSGGGGSGSRDGGSVSSAGATSGSTWGGGGSTWDGGGSTSGDGGTASGGGVSTGTTTTTGSSG